MKKLILINVLLIIQLSLSAQCANSYIGDYDANACANTSGNWLAKVKAISPDKILISYFANLPDGIFHCVDTIIADLHCADSSLTLEPVTYPMYLGNLTYSGYGTISHGSIILNIHQINPDGENDFCYRYYDFTGIKDNGIAKSIFEVYPNPSRDAITLQSNLNGKYTLELFDVLGNKNKVVDIDNPKSQKINLAGISTGIHLYRIEDMKGNIMQTGKLIIQD